MRSICGRFSIKIQSSVSTQYQIKRTTPVEVTLKGLSEVRSGIGPL